MPSLAARTRDAVRARPPLRTALAAGALNHTAAARLLVEDLGLAAEDREAVTAALRRYADDLTVERTERAATVRMVTGVGVEPGTEAAEDGLLALGETAVREGAGDGTALVIEGDDADPETLSAVLGRLAAEGIDVRAAGAGDGRAVAVVGRRDGATAVRVVEDALTAVTTVTE
jgi:hypothetical protein